MSAAQGLFLNSQDCCHFPFCQPNEHCISSVSASELNKSLYSSLTLLKWLLKLPTICSLWVFHALISHGSCGFPFFLPQWNQSKRIPFCNPTDHFLLKIFPFWSLILFTSMAPALEQEIQGQCIPSPCAAEIAACLIGRADVMLLLFTTQVTVQWCVHTVPKSTKIHFNKLHKPTSVTSKPQ